ncbi:hypothetical protein [Halolamina salifodinae]|uniref:Uncharacterized protein n=1 Tax=Halolamina salifodinae TaxID=1202767 RepID=A0A8T4GT18_9EURY|nr:hypothetical protein [Halolamina salifodinae]MBP1986231.1 hypothetical protein [Halolamina salifodinae]
MPTLAELFRLGQVVVLSATLPIAIIAARGYRDAPFGRVVRPLVPITLSYLGVAAIKLLEPSMGADASKLLGSVAIALIAWTGLQAILLLSGRREL